MIGDAAYPLTEHIITPFKKRGEPLTMEQQQFNYIQSSTRMCIQKTFGVLKGRFHRLKFEDVKDLEYALMLIVVTCMLHKFCLSEGHLDEYLAKDADVIGCNPPDALHIFPDEQSGQCKQQEIVAELLRN